MKLSLKGRVEVRIGKKGLRLDNDVSPDFALALAQTLLIGSQSATGYGSGFALPTGVVIVLLNGSSVVATIQVNVSKFTDQFTPQGELTSVTYIGSDATPTQYSFDSLELYTVVGSTLYMKIAYVNLGQTVTKNQNDIVQVTWVEQILSGGALISYTNQQNACSACTGTCNTSTLKTELATSSVANFVWALMIVPNLNKVVTNTSVPMYNYVNYYFQAYLQTKSLPQLLGVQSVFITDSCLNILQTITVQSPIITSSLSDDLAIVSMGLYLQPTQGAYYALPIFVIKNSISAFLGLVQVQNASQVSSGQLTITIEIPYGHPTLQSLQVNT